jgi:Kef-type K+ transport system membrane component KefB
LEVLDKVYYARALLGVIVGVTAGSVIIPGTDQGMVLSIIILIAFVFYLLSYGISRRIGRTILKSHKRKLATDGIFPFIFLLLMFMILVYTMLHQELAL